MRAEIHRLTDQLASGNPLIVTLETARYFVRQAAVAKDEKAAKDVRDANPAPRINYYDPHDVL